MASDAPIRVAIVNDFEIVVKGLAQMCEGFADRIHVVEIAANKPGVGDVDIALFDTFSQTGDPQDDIARLLTESRADRVVMYSWNLHPELVSAALEQGASAYLAKSLTGEELIEALERVHRGEQVVSSASDASSHEAGNWPGRTQGLTNREAEIIALITQGLSNQQIADRAFLSINSVKSYIRSSYRKIGVSSRSQAVLWGVAHGFRPDSMRQVRPREATEA